MLRLIYLLFLLVLSKEYFVVSYRQEGAVVKYFNRKYFSEFTAITKREKRGQPYKTNITCTTLQPWYNNVTLQISYGLNEYSDMLKVRTKICEIVKINWLNNYFKTYSNVAKYLSACPLVVGTYGFYNMEFPPKEFPLPIPKGDITLKFLYEQTETKERMSEVTMVLHER